jgi:3-deoxy-manno-octulosonate cytidylyltransferase (CMP-KDO synthetase)
MRTVVIIPVRMASERLPGKPLKMIGGKTIVELCCLSALSSAVDKVYIATADIDIFWVVAEQTDDCMCSVIFTSNDPINGTERIAEAARILQLRPDDIVINLQGDMPFFDPEIIDRPVRLMKTIPDCNMVSVRTKLSKEDYDNPNRVKVTVDEQSRAASFARTYKENAFLHIGVYVFRNSFLQRYSEYGMVAKERQDHLEQQRVMHMGEPIYMAYVNSSPTVIDTEEDLEKARCQIRE